jgi:hypothetical protein
MSLIKVLHLAVDMDNLFVCFFVHVYTFWPLFFGLFLDHKETYGDWYQLSLLERTSARKHTLVFSAYRSLPLKTEIAVDDSWEDSLYSTGCAYSRIKKRK